MNSPVPKLDLDFLSKNQKEHDNEHSYESYGYSDRSDNSSSTDQYPRLYRLNTIRFKWKKIRCIGKGNSAEVYEAFRKDTGTIFALKGLTSIIN